MSKKIFVSLKSDLQKEGSKTVEAEGESIVLILLENKVYALEDVCTHEGAALSEGEIHKGKIDCPWHSATFDIKTGKVLSGPTQEDLKTFRVIEEEDQIYVEL